VLSPNSERLPFRMSDLLARVEELNQLAGDGCGQLVPSKGAGAGGLQAHVLHTPDPVRLSVFKDGLQVRSASCQSVCQATHRRPIGTLRHDCACLPAMFIKKLDVLQTSLLSLQHSLLDLHHARISSTLPASFAPRPDSQLLCCLCWLPPCSSTGGSCISNLMKLAAHRWQTWYYGQTHQILCCAFSHCPTAPPVAGPPLQRPLLRRGAQGHPGRLLPWAPAH
jgi:hypothetical protein